MRHAAEYCLTAGIASPLRSLTQSDPVEVRSSVSTSDPFYSPASHLQPGRDMRRCAPHIAYFSRTILRVCTKLLDVSL